MTQTIQQKENKLQINRTDHLRTLPKKERENEEENKLFDLVLVDIRNTIDYGYIRCVKKNMYDPELKYICISYRWGELQEQLLSTPDYTAHITSFALIDIENLCSYIHNEPDFSKIDYLWVDAISVDQQNHARKKDTILKMNQIYQHATYILAVPDLHKEYLWNHPTNMEIFTLLSDQYDATIYNEIVGNEWSDNDYINKDDINNNNLVTTNPIQQNQQIHHDDPYLFIQKLKMMNILNEDDIKKLEALKTEVNDLKTEVKEKEKEIKELKIEVEKKEKQNELEKEDENKVKIYQFLAYLINDWSNRAWVISEYHIAKEKYIHHGTPLKYIFMCLLGSETYKKPFFSYHFNEDDEEDDDYLPFIINNNLLTHKEAINPKLFNLFVKSRFMQRPHLEMILNSNATRNEDRFHAILPSWNKYNHLIKNKDTIPDWNITDMISVRLKLYENMDLWDKANLLMACKESNILPTFASQCHINYLNMFEKLVYNNSTYKKLEEESLDYMDEFCQKETADKIIKLIKEYHVDSKSIWNENLVNIQFNSHHCYLSIKSKIYFIKNIDDHNDKKYYQNELSLDDDDDIHYVLIPFFRTNLSGLTNFISIHSFNLSINLIGNINKNRWILKKVYSFGFKSRHFCSDNYTFNIY